PCEAVYREHLEGALQPVLAAAAGYLTSAVAQLSEGAGVVRPGEGFGALVSRVLADTWQDAERRKRKTPEQLVEEKRKKLRHKAEVLKARQAHAAALPAWLARRPTFEGRAQRYGWHHGVLVLRDVKDDVREANAAMLRALAINEALATSADGEAEEELRRLDRKWTADEISS
ncbi:MAG: hypothetical protein AB1938_33105, partial [Myxococcota bacterium]